MGGRSRSGLRIRIEELPRPNDRLRIAADWFSVREPREFRNVFSLSRPRVFDAAFSSAELVVQLEVSGGSVSSQQLYRARNTTATQELPVLAAQDAGGSDCLGLNAIPDGELGQEYSVVATFYDIAGNSASSEPLSFTLSEVKPADCTASVVPQSSASVGVAPESPSEAVPESSMSESAAPESPSELSEPSTSRGVAPDGVAEGCTVQKGEAGFSLWIALFLMGVASVRSRTRVDRHGV